MKSFKPERIYLTPGAQDYPLTTDLLNRFSSAEVIRLPDRKPPVLPVNDYYQAVAAGKRQLFLQVNPVSAPHPCPATPHHLCCGLRVFDLVEGCPYDCQYCVLQCYLNNPLINVSVNVEEFVSALEAEVLKRAPQIYRVTMGELTDCLALDDILQINRHFIELARRQPNLLVEFKSKGGPAEHLLKEKGVKNAVFSFSVNPQPLIDELEAGTEPLSRRIELARAFAELGYSLGFHLDPVVPGDYIEQYKAMLEQIFASVPSAKVRWISLGSLRFFKPMKDMLRSRFPTSSLLSAPLLPGHEGKLRLVEQQRIDTFKPLVDLLKRLAPRTYVYLCMESEKVWNGVFGRYPAGCEEFRSEFDRQVAAKY